MEMMAQYDTTLMADGTTLVEPAVQLLTEKRVPQAKSVSPTLCFWILFGIILLLSIIARIKNWKLYWLDGIIFGIVCIVSLVLIYLWFGSDHWCTKANFNLMWANPLFLILLFRLRRKNTITTLVIAGIMLVQLIGWNLLPQHFNSAVFPMVLTLMVRLADRVVKFRV